MTLEGIDVSHHNGTFDWRPLPAAGISFAYAKATESIDDVDPTYPANRRGAKNAGVAFGAYHFARPDQGDGDAYREADHFLSVAQPSKGDLLPVLDLEAGAGDLTGWVLDFCDRVHDAVGRRPVIYASPDFWTEHVQPAKHWLPFLLWVANYDVSRPRVPAPWSSWTFWQYTDRGRIGSMSGTVDRDRFAGDAAELAKWAL